MMATLAEIQADKHKWEVVPGTSGRPGGTRYQLKKEHKEEQRKQLKKTTTPTTTKRVDKPTTSTKKSTISNLEKLQARPTETGPGTSLYSAVAEGSKRAERARERKREAKETPFGVRTHRGRAMLSSLEQRKLARRKAAREASIRERAPVTRTKLPTPKVTDPVQLKRLSDAIAATKRREAAPAKPRYSTEASKKLKQLVDENEREKERKRNEEFSLSVEKTGGKVSRRSGGKVKKWQGGNLEVSQFYD